jgi:DEAD/DEAH box helicase
MSRSCTSDYHAEHVPAPCIPTMPAVPSAARVMDYIEQGKLSVAGVKFFVLDEADRLLDTGSQVLFRSFCKAD